MKPILSTRIAEIVYALIIGAFALNHFLYAEKMAAYVPEFLPGDDKLWVYLSGAAFGLAALAILTGIMKPIASYLLALFLMLVACSIHLRGLISAVDEASKSMYMSNLLKDFAIAMCAIIIGNNRSK